MPMVQGSVAVDDSGNVTGTGYALALFNARWAVLSPKIAATSPPASIVDAKKGVAEVANADAGVIAYIQANAQVPAAIPVSTTGTAAAQTGATTAPGTIV